MTRIAAKDQTQETVFDRELGDKLSFAKSGADTPMYAGANVAFVGYAVWRREENGDANLSDEQVFEVREGRVRPLPPRTDLSDHSPDGLSWGYHGSASAQLAVALLMAVFNDWERVRPIYHTFKDKFVSRIPQNTNWTADGSDILLLALEIERSTSATAALS